MSNKVYRSSSLYVLPFVGLSSLLLLGCQAGDKSSDKNDEQVVFSSEYPGVACQEVKTPMRDGTLLHGVVYYPEEEKGTSFPTIVSRSPYGNSGYGASTCFPEIPQVGLSLDRFAISYVEEEYAVLIQDVRGASSSDGVFNLIHQEKDDGYDTIEWAASQSWSNGNVGIQGGSYLGLTSWQTVISNPPSLKAASIQISGANYHREWTYVNGIFSPLLNMSWTSTVFMPDQIIRQGRQNGLTESEIDLQVSDYRARAATNLYSDWLWQLPLTSFTEFDGLVDSYQEWLQHLEYDEYWSDIDVEEQVGNVQIPVLIKGSWYDLFANGSVASFEAMKNSAATEQARTETKLLMTPYGHSVDHNSPSFGSVPKTNAAQELAYFNKYLKGIDNGFEDSPTAELYVMLPPNEGNEGSTFTVSSSQYPLEETEYTPFYLGSDGDANNREGSGSLVMEPETRDLNISATEYVDSASFAADLFSYDPANPVPTTGGNLCCATDYHPQGYKSGAIEQAEVEIRDDVLVYTSAPLTEDLVVIGPVSVQLFAKSSAMDTDFMAKLVDVRPDGQTHNVVDGAVRARLREGSKQPSSLIEPNQTYEYTIPMGPTAAVFPAGHRIRLQISSSNFPRFARNLNTGLSNETTSEMAIANQVVLHDASHPSRLILPIVSGISIPE